MNLRKDHYRCCSPSREFATREQLLLRLLASSSSVLVASTRRRRRGWSGPALPSWREREEAIKAGILCLLAVLPAPLRWTFSVLSLSVSGWYSVALSNMSDIITFNGGPLGSCIDEERRELRYLV